MKLCALSDSFRDAPGLRNGLHHFGCLINTITCPILWARLLPMEPLTVAGLLAALFHMILDLLKHAHRLLHSRRHNRRCPAFLVTIGLTICGHRQPALSLYCLHCPQPVIRHPATACDSQARILVHRKFTAIPATSQCRSVCTLCPLLFSAHNHNCSRFSKISTSVSLSHILCSCLPASCHRLARIFSAFYKLFANQIGPSRPCTLMCCRTERQN